MLLLQAHIEFTQAYIYTFQLGVTSLYVWNTVSLCSWAGTESGPPIGVIVAQPECRTFVGREVSVRGKRL
jgi:hypothetical protein